MKVTVHQSSSAPDEWRIIIADEPDRGGTDYVVAFAGPLANARAERHRAELESAVEAVPPPPKRDGRL